MNELFNLEQQIQAATKKKKAGLVLKNGKYLNVFTKEFIKGDIAVEKGKIVGIGSYEGENEIDIEGKYIVPSFIDSHMHFESSIVSPREYAKAVITHGTSAVIADPHEIGNVLGEIGIDYMLDTTANLPLDAYIMMSSCVPATPFDESGACIDSIMIKSYLENERILGLAEMMNYPGVLNNDYQVLKKINVTKKKNKSIDGHAPRLTKEELNAYIASGVSSDHECTSFQEALEKLTLGQYIQLREGTACKNLENLIGLIKEPYTSRLMFSTDDKHPSDLIKEGHIDHIIRKAIKFGADPISCYIIASFNPAIHYNLKDTGAIAPGYKADFVVLDDYEKVIINSCYKNGFQITSYDKILNEEELFKPLDLSTKQAKEYIKRITNTMNYDDISLDDIKISTPTKIIGLVPNEILTTDEGINDTSNNIDVEHDILKLCVIERHKNTGHIGKCYVKGYGLKEGAIATSISHDSHNVIVCGTNDSDIVFAVNSLKRINGGMIIVKDNKIIESLSLPIAGLMSNENINVVNEKINKLKEISLKQGCNNNIDPFMTLSFTSLAVIPTLRLTTMGIVDVEKFKLIK